MAAVTTPKLGLRHRYNEGESGWKANLDADILKLSVLVQASVKDKDLNTPPGSPANGDTYIVAAVPTGAWSGHAKDIAYWDGPTSAWVFYTPVNGWWIYVDDEDVHYRYNSAGAWVNIG